MKERWLAAAALGAVVLPWLPGLGGSLLADDWALLADALGPDNGRLLLDRFFTPLPEDVVPRFWRPLWHASLWLDGHLFGPSGLALQASNLVIHAVCVLLFGRLLRRLGHAPAVAWGAAACAGLSPLGHEAVGWVAARCGPLALAGVLGAALLSLREDRGRWLAPGAALLGLLSKESAFVVWPVCAAAIWAGGRGPAEALRRSWPVAAVMPLYLAGRIAILGTPLGGYVGLDAVPDLVELLPSRLETVVTLLSLMRSQVVGGAGPILAAGVTALLLVGFTRADARRHLAFLLAWSAMALVPVAYFAVPADHEDVRFLHESGFALCGALGLATASFLGARAAAALAILLGAGLFLNLGPRRAATQEAAILVREVRRLAAQPHATPLVLFAVPDGREHAHIGRNTFPAALHPALGSPPLGGPTRVTLDSVGGRCTLRRILDRTGPPPAVRTLRWQDGRFVPSLPGRADAVCPPAVRRHD